MKRDNKKLTAMVFTFGFFTLLYCVFTMKNLGICVEKDDCHIIKVKND